tara:strand:+ start:4597 stop:4800 length:204 start_codon:yes stop_codon:yes gene_type:complete
MKKRFLFGMVTGVIATLATQKIIEVRRDMKLQREMYPYGAYLHFRKMEQAGRDRFYQERSIRRMLDE